MIVLRIISFIILFLSAVATPWPVTAGLAVIFIAAFPWFWEAFIVSLALGVMYDFPSGPQFLFLFFVSSFSSALFVEEYFKRLIEGQNILSRIIIAVSGAITIVLFWLLLKFIL